MKPYKLAQLANEIMSGKTLNEANDKSYSPANDYEGEMAITQLKAMIEKAQVVLSMLKPEAKLEAWVQSKITLADDYMSSVSDYLKHTDGAIGESVEVNEENLDIGTYGFRIDRDGGKFVLYQLSYSQGSVRFPDGRKGTVIGRYATRDEAISAAKKNAGVKEEVENVEEGVRMMAGAEKMVKDDPIGGSSMVSSLRAAKKSLEGKPTGSVLVVTKEKSPESMSIKVYAPSDFASLTKSLSKKPEAKVGSKGSWSGGEVTVIAIKEEVEIAEQFKAGDKVKVPHKGKMVSGKIVRYDDGGTSKAQQHGGGYVVDVGEPASVLVPKEKVRKEAVEMTEAPMIAPPDTTLRGYSPTQFENKFRELLSRLGFSKALPIKKFGTSFWVSFENMPKARDFSMTLENLMRRNMKPGVKLTKVLSLEAGDEAIAKGIVPSSTRAVVVVNLGNVMQEAFESYGFVAEDFYKNAKEEV